MSKTLTKLLTTLSCIFLLVAPINSAFAKSKADLKAIKECTSVNNLYSTKIYDSLTLGTGESRSSAQRELIESNATPKILINCALVSAKSWLQIRNDYTKVVKKAASELKRIQIKYSQMKDIEITCIKEGINQIVRGIDPKCPDGYTKL